MKSYFNLHTK